MIKLSELYFRHQSKSIYELLRPISYDRVQEESERSDEYMESRIETEDAYRRLLKSAGVIHPKDTSFLYATVVGFHGMKSANDYPGYTYYFHITPNQLSETIFEVVDKNHSLPPMVGRHGFERCLKHWMRYRKDMSSYREEFVEGIILPRIEVIIPYVVAPIKLVRQVEDR